MTNLKRHKHTKFGEYKLVDKIASGGMAELFLAETHGPGGFRKPVVIKMIHDEYSTDPRFVSMFTHEAKVLAGFVHGNIVPIFDFGKIKDRPYLVMEFIDGVDLETLTETCKIGGISLPPETVLWIGAGAAAGLHYAHTATDSKGAPLNVVHRDVSPHNILVSQAGEVKLCDFGIAFSKTRETGTDAGLIKGKLHYLSPEQATGKRLDPRSDIFSLGVTLYEMLAGHHPISNSSGVTVLRTLTESNSYPPLRDAAPWLHPHIAEIIDKAISFDPSHRYGDAESLRKSLIRTLHEIHPHYSPKTLGDLVVQVQNDLNSTNTSSLDSLIGAQLASYSSEIHTTTKTQTNSSSTHPLRSKSLMSAVIIALFGLFTLAWWTQWGSSTVTQSTSPKLQATLAQESIPPTVPPIETSSSIPLSISPSNTANEEPSQPPPVETTIPEMQTTLARIAESKPRSWGYLNVNASPWAEVKIDGKPYGTTPVLGLKLPAGKHSATFKNPDFKSTVSRRFVIKPKQTTKLIVELIQ